MSSRFSKDSKSTSRGQRSTNPFADPAPPSYLQVTMADTDDYTQDTGVIAIAAENGISPYFATQLGRVEDFADVHVIIDDSESTNRQFRNPKTYAPMTIAGCSNAWDLQQSMITAVFPVLSALRREAPVTVHRLNKDALGTTVTSLADLQPIFEDGPALVIPCGTPTTAVMDAIPHTDRDREMGVLTCLLTDGEPFGGFDHFKYWLRNYQSSRPGSFVQIGLASCDPVLTEQYETAIDGIPGVDVSCVYEIEEPQITKIQGKKFTFTRGDWKTKFLLGPKVKEWDDLDDRKLSRDELRVVRKHAEKYFTSLVSASDCSVM